MTLTKINTPSPSTIEGTASEKSMVEETVAREGKVEGTAPEEDLSEGTAPSEGLDEGTAPGECLAEGATPGEGMVDLKRTSEHIIRDDSSPEGSETSTYYGFTLISVFVVMGKSGAGKSHFIHMLGGRDFLGRKPVVHAGTESCTKTAEMYMTTIDKKYVLLLDTPGFDDSGMSNFKILETIMSQLYCLALRRVQFKIRGVIFLHDISETRYGGSQKKTWNILESIVGKSHLENVIVGTTMWSDKGSRKFIAEEEREQALRGYWGGIYKVTRILEKDKAIAAQVVTDLFTKPPFLLLCQHEMLQSPHTIESTTAGKTAIPEGLLELEELQGKYLKEKQEMEEEKSRREASYKLKNEELSEQIKRGKEREKKIAEKERERNEAKLIKEMEDKAKELEDKAKELEDKTKEFEEARERSKEPPQKGWFGRMLDAVITWFKSFGGESKE